jgi:hypothetical protein
MILSGGRLGCSGDEVLRMEASDRPIGLESSAEQPPPEPLTDPRRAQRLAAIRALIDAGTYETHERLEAALDRFLVVVDGS